MFLEDFLPNNYNFILLFQLLQLDQLKLEKIRPIELNYNYALAQFRQKLKLYLKVIFHLSSELAFYHYMHLKEIYNYIEYAYANLWICLLKNHGSSLHSSSCSSGEMPGSIRATLHHEVGCGQVGDSAFSFCLLNKPVSWH